MVLLGIFLVILCWGEVGGGDVSIWYSIPFIKFYYSLQIYTFYRGCSTTNEVCLEMTLLVYLRCGGDILEAIGHSDGFVASRGMT